jgi:hypothetical protein
MQLKLSESQKRVMGLILAKKVKAYKDGLDYSYYCPKGGGYIPTSTANALFKRGLFTVDDNGYCNLTELGLTIEF